MQLRIEKPLYYPRTLEAIARTEHSFEFIWANDLHPLEVVDITNSDERGD